MQYQLIVYSTDAVFARMLAVEFLMREMTALVCEQTDPTLSCEVALLDLDSVPPPLPHTYRRMIGFTRGVVAVDEEIRRQCSMILYRPFEMSALRREVLSGGETVQVQTVVRERQDAIAERICLDAERRIIGLDGAEIALTPNEFAVAELLLSSRGVVVSREQIAERIGESDANKVDVYVCYLRRKLEKLTPVRVIRTLRKKGYMIP